MHYGASSAAKPSGAHSRVLVLRQLSHGIPRHIPPSERDNPAVDLHGEFCSEAADWWGTGRLRFNKQHKLVFRPLEETRLAHLPCADRTNEYLLWHECPSCPSKPLPSWPASDRPYRGGGKKMVASHGGPFAAHSQGISGWTHRSGPPASAESRRGAGTSVAPRLKCPACVCMQSCCWWCAEDLSELCTRERFILVRPRAHPQRDALISVPQGFALMIYCRVPGFTY